MNKEVIIDIENPKDNDLISRQAVLALVADYDLSMGQVVKCIHALPSVNVRQTEKKCVNCQHLDTFLCVDCKAENHWEQKVERQTGEWIEKDGYDGDVYYDCSVCGESWTTIEGTPWDNGMKFCPNCGAKMVEPKESEDKE